LLSLNLNNIWLYSRTINPISSSAFRCAPLRRWATWKYF
jgi:hypothetical protein